MVRPTRVGEDIVYALMKVRGDKKSQHRSSVLILFSKTYNNYKECDDMQNDIGIYCIENQINGKKYIGQSIHIRRRWSEHKYDLNNNIHENDYLQKAWNKYGCENFHFFILEYCEIEDLDKIEDDYIAQYNTLDRNFGYNLVSGVGVYRTLSDETREKLRQAGKRRKNIPIMKGKDNPNFGKRLSKEAKDKIRDARIGTKASDETRRKLSEQRKGANNPRCVPIYCPELNESFWGAKEAEEKYDVNRNKISECINGKRKHAGVHPITGEKLSWVKLENKNC